MIDEVETLQALATHKTMGKAALSLRVTQSTVSKRIQTLEHKCNKELIVKVGRNVELTLDGKELLLEALPHIRSLKEIFDKPNQQEETSLIIGFSEAILSSWGSKLLAKFAKKNKDVIIEPHAHRSPVIIEKIASSDFNFGIIAGDVKEIAGLYYEKIGKEEMVLIGESGRLFCVEITSGTWRSIEKDVLKKKITIDERSEFFFPIVNLVKNGFCRGLVPETVAISAGFKESDMTYTGIYRPIYAAGRKSAYQRKDIVKLVDFFKQNF